MSLKLKIYIGVITTSAIVLFIYLIPSLPSLSNIWFVLIFFLAISAFAEFIPVDLPVSGAVSIGFPIDFVLILVYGPALAMLITALGALIGETIERERSWYKEMFNASQFALSAGLAGIVYQKLGGIVGAVNLSNYIIPAIACALVYYLVNSNLFIMVTHLAEGKSIWSIWKTQLKGIIVTYIALAPIGFIMAMVYVTIGIWGIILFFFPLILARRSFELYTKMRRVYLETIRALAAAIDAKDPYTKGHPIRILRI